MSTDHARPFIAIRPWLRAGLLRHLSPSASRILFLMVDYTGTDGYAFPSAHTLANQTGHARKVIYGALKELVDVGCLERMGRTKWIGHGHPGPAYYCILEFDGHAERALRGLESLKRPRGDAARFAPKMHQTQKHLNDGKKSQTEEHLNGERCSCERPPRCS